MNDIQQRNSYKPRRSYNDFQKEIGGFQSIEQINKDGIPSGIAVF